MQGKPTTEEVKMKTDAEVKTSESEINTESKTSENKPFVAVSAASPTKLVQKAKGPTVKVMGLVNMHCLDGTFLEVKKLCELSKAEFERLSNGSREKLFEVQK